MASSGASDACRFAETTHADDDSELVDTVALIPLEPADNDGLPRFAETQDRISRTMLGTLLAEPAEAARLVVDPDPGVRALAQECAVARVDAADVLARARRLSVRADVGIIRAEGRLARMGVLRSELAATPDFALSWRARWMDHSEISDHGMSIAFERALDGERGLALALP